MKGLVLDAEWKPKKEYVPSEQEEKTRKAINGSLVWKKRGLELKEVKKPETGKHELLIKIKNCGICGSDIHFYETDTSGYILYPGLTRFPCIIGHEFSGVVEEIGSAVDGFEQGDLVTSEEMMWCGECVPCRDGFPNHCEKLEEIGFTVNGALAEYIAVDSKYCWKLNAIKNTFRNDAAALEAGALVEPTSVAYNGIFERAGGFRPGDCVAVWGGGPIGLAAVALSRVAGASKIFAFELSKERRELARKLGADFVYNPDELHKQGSSESEKVLDFTSGQGVDMCVEAAGVPQKTILEMEKCLNINAKIVQIGRAAQRVPIYLERFQVRRSQIFGAQGHSGHGTFHRVISLMTSRGIDMRKIITAKFYLDHAVEAIEKASKRDDGKVMVKI
jgi:hypothetical protein